MTYLNLSETDLLARGALHTAREIAGQPALWESTAEKFDAERQRILGFLEKALSECDQIILTGAGTSAFIGLSLLGSFFSRTRKLTRAVPTTDLLSHPRHYLRQDQSPLIISFARSGKSPESVATLELADKLCNRCFHLIITCNAEGSLAQYNSQNASCVFVLPSEANDKSLAMTGSYSAMLLTALLVAYAGDPDYCRRQLGYLVRLAEKILSRDAEMIRKIADKEFRRAVFLGSGPLFGTATEAALKLQELTDGQVISKAESYLGFRHGPKAVIDETTLVVYFFSNDDYVHQYETDILDAMRTGNPALFHLAVAEQQIGHPVIGASLGLGLEDRGAVEDGQLSKDGRPGKDDRLSEDGGRSKDGRLPKDATSNGRTVDDGIAEDFLAVCSILPGQLLGFYKSLQLGLMPDSPSVNGAISRIVEGVTIYPVEA